MTRRNPTIEAVHEHLADAAFALVECVDDAGPDDLADLAEVARNLTAAQQWLLRLPSRGIARAVSRTCE